MVNARRAMEQLFVSRVRIKVLYLLFSHPDVPVHLRGAVRELREEINSIRREMSRLEEIKLLKIDVRGNRKYYVLNREGPFYDELRGMVFKTFGLGGEIIKNQARIGGIKYAILTGSYVTGITVGAHPVDLVIVGDVNVDELNSIVSECERKEERQINFTVLKTNDFELRKRRRDSFVMELLLNSKLMLIGSSEELAQG